MKKIVISFFAIISAICLMNKNSDVLIPSKAIRIRIIANSDNIQDQEIKAKIKNEINNILYSKLKNIDDYNTAEETIKNSLYDIKNTISKFTDNYYINYGKNYFPNKEYKGVKYNEGEYNSLVITLGEGKGKNFWCVLFPPLCMIDEQKLNNVSYSLYVSELLKRIE